MPAYPSTQTSTIGALLRQIQEDKLQSPMQTPPSTEVNNPIRNLAQTSLQQVESPESAARFAVRPEITPPGGTPGSAEPEPNVVPPASPVVVPPATFVPPAPSAPGPSSSQPSTQSSPSNQPSSQPAPSSSPQKSVLGTSAALNLATRILPNITTKPKTQPKPTQAPAQRRVGPYITNEQYKLIPTPTPEPPKKTNQKSKPPGQVNWWGYVA